MGNIFLILAVVVSLLNVFGLIQPVIGFPLVMVCLITGVYIKMKDKKEAE